MQLDIRTRRVEEIDTEHAVTLVLAGGVSVRIESPFDLIAPGSEPRTIDPEDLSFDQGLQQALRCRVVEAASADSETGLLDLSFEGGVRLQVPSDPDFESWSATWPDGSAVVALPGGGLSSWGPQP